MRRLRRPEDATNATPATEPNEPAAPPPEEITDPAAVLAQGNAAEPPARRQRVVRTPTATEPAATPPVAAQESPLASPSAVDANAPRGNPTAQTVTVTAGEEIFTPRQYHTYKVGPFTATAYVLEGETVAQAVTRVLQQLETVFVAAHARKKAAYEARAS